MITLKTLKEASEQEVFDQVATHLLKQNLTSLRNGLCAYRGIEGLKCAAGCLIADDEYRESWEGLGWPEVILKARAAGYTGASNHDLLIEKLQIVHDSYGPSSWRRKLRAIAEDYELETTVIDEYEKR